MPIENKFESVPEDSPDRCQSLNSRGQCIFKKLDGSSFCAMHGGNKAIQAKEKESLNNYRLTKYQTRINNFTTNPSIKSIREEIGILRMLLEETINKCIDSNDLIMYASKISDLVMKIEKLVSSCHRLENKLGLMLDKMAALQLSNEIVTIISDHVTDPEAVDSIANGIANLLK